MDLSSYGTEYLSGEWGPGTCVGNGEEKELTACSFVIVSSVGMTIRNVARLSARTFCISSASSRGRTYRQ
jgi:hypothetical protein